MGQDERIVESEFGSAERFKRVVIASYLTCAVPSRRICMSKGMAVVEAMMGLMLAQADRVWSTPVAYSFRFGFGDCRKETSGLSTPALTILILLLQIERRVGHCKH